MQKNYPLNLEVRQSAHPEKGSTVLQLVIAVALVGIISAFAIISFRKTRANLRMQNSTRQLASYLEKARLDAVRRHDNSNVVFTDDHTYNVTMDFSGSGTVTTRTFQFDDGVSVFSTPLPNLTFNWRGRISRCTNTFALRNEPGEQSYLDVSDAGDVTVNNDVNVLPNANYATVNASSDVATTAVVSGGAVHNNSLDCDTSGSGVAGPPITGGGPGCLDTANPSSVSIKKGGGTTQIAITATNTGTVAVSAPINLSVTPATQTVAGGGTVNFSVTSLNNTRGTFAVNFNSPCTTLTVLVTVTN